jgi:uncharacterized damage-inducible protein DinB
MNPYASYLESRNPSEVIAATGPNLREIVGGLSDEQVNRAPAPGKWSIREILCHLADCEAVFAFRIRQTLAQPDHVIQPFDQEIWARNYSAYTAPEALAAFTAMREWNVALIRTLSPDALNTPVTHPERGQMTLQTILETMGGHDINHLQQIRGIASRAASA